MDIRCNRLRTSMTLNELRQGRGQDYQHQGTQLPTPGAKITNIRVQHYQLIGDNITNSKLIDK